MSAKLIMYWDIKPGRDQDYFEFVVREWGPGITRLGIELSGLWYTSYSNGTAAQIMAEAVTEDLRTMRQLLKSTEWGELHDKLLDCVTNYHHKVVHTSGEFQI